MVPFIKAHNETAALVGFQRARPAEAEVETKQRPSPKAISSTLPHLEPLHSSVSFPFSFYAGDFYGNT